MNELVQPPAPFLPPSEYIEASSCDVDMAKEKQEDDSDIAGTSWQIKDSVFRCDAMPYCDITCEGPDQTLLRQTTRECGCTVEWFLHSLWLKIVLSLMVYGVTNASRIGFVAGLSRLFWRRLHPSRFTVLTSYKEDGTFIHGAPKGREEHSGGKDDSVDCEQAALIRREINRNMFRFQAKGLGMVVCAAFANIAWIWALRMVNAPEWLVDE